MRRAEPVSGGLPCPTEARSWVQKKERKKTRLHTGGDWRVTLSDWNLVLPDTTLIPIRRTGSSFLCGHHNVNSLSLSISGKDYRGLRWSWGHILCTKNGSKKKKNQTHHLTCVLTWTMKSARSDGSGCRPMIGGIWMLISSHSEDGDGNPSLRAFGGFFVTVMVWLFATDELYQSTHQRLKEIPLKDPLSFKQPRTSRAAFIFKAYPVTKDTPAACLHYMRSGCKLADVSASLCPSAIHAV